MSTLSFACSLLNQVPLAQVQHVVVAEALLHLVEFVGADRVEVKALKLLLEDLGNGEVVEVVHGALEEKVVTLSQLYAYFFTRHTSTSLNTYVFGKGNLYCFLYLLL